MARRAAAGTGTIRKKTLTRGDKQYTYWEARATVGYDPGTGKQIQRTFTGKTQKEVAQKLKAATASIDEGTYTAPSKMTISQWLDIWTAEYLGGVKPATVASYKTIVNTHLKPGLGATKLDTLNAHTIQGFYNSLEASPKTVKNVHGVLHKAMQQAVNNGYIRFNPTEACVLPRVEKKEIQPLDETQITAFLKAIHGHKFENLYIVTLFTGLREGEALGLLWDCVDLEKGTLQINKQLQLSRSTGGEYVL
ncbi:MAG: tyrosine-type recombinase/integrase family protein, partial [Oscillospiraceae bacterium]|nr:tyrosine-type recombinase/integrase family protein [Oscillospiraceae bacterium]